LTRGKKLVKEKDDELILDAGARKNYISLS
jgi:hypothetical protein